MTCSQKYSQIHYGYAQKPKYFFKSETKHDHIDFDNTSDVINSPVFSDLLIYRLVNLQTCKYGPVKVSLHSPLLTSIPFQLSQPIPLFVQCCAFCFKFGEKFEETGSLQPEVVKIYSKSLEEFFNKA